MRDGKTWCRVTNLESNPFGMLTFLVAPAILTNASSIIALSTSNRFGLAIDRVKSIVAEQSQLASAHDSAAAIRTGHLRLAERRVLLLVRALTVFYLSVGSFAAATLVSLMGTILSATTSYWVQGIPLAFGLVAGVLGVAGLIAGCVILLLETRIAYSLLIEESTFRATRSEASQSPPTLNS
jgi:hypothetical protein